MPSWRQMCWNRTSDGRTGSFLMPWQVVPWTSSTILNPPQPIQICRIWPPQDPASSGSLVWRNQSLDRWERKDARVCAFLLVLCKQPGLMKSMLMTYAADISVNIPVGKPTWLWAPWTCCLRTLSTALVSIGTPIVKIQSNWNAKSINGPYTRSTAQGGGGSFKIGNL